MPSVALSTPTSGESTPARVNSARMSIGSPAVAWIAAVSDGGFRNAAPRSVPSITGLSSTTSRPSTNRRPWFAPAKPSRILPVSSGVYVVCSTRRSAVATGASPPNQTSALERRFSLNSSLSSASTNVEVRPGSPVRGLVMCSSGSAATPSCTTAPSSYETRASGSAARIASSGEMTRSGITVALPPPWVRASRALCPMTAMLAIEPASRGRMPSLLSSTAPSTAASWASATPSIVARRHGDRPVERADTLGEQQQPQHLAVEVLLRSRGRRARRRRDAPTPEPARAWRDPARRGSSRGCARRSSPRSRPRRSPTPS